MFDINSIEHLFYFIKLFNLFLKLVLTDKLKGYIIINVDEITNIKYEMERCKNYESGRVIRNSKTTRNKQFK